jgi:segregation and condensation protein A
LEYQQYKEAAGILAASREKQQDIFYRAAAPRFGEDDYMLKASVFDLLNAFKKLLEQAPKEVGQILRDEIPLEVKIREVLDLLSERTSIAFEELFATSRRRIDLIVTFLALLELIRLKQVVARQSDLFGEIRLYRVDAVPQTAVVEPAAKAPAPLEDATPQSASEPALPASSGAGNEGEATT